jgi:hypothetical protein
MLEVTYSQIPELSHFAAIGATVTPTVTTWMDDFLGRDYTAAQRKAANAPPCPQCGSTNVSVSWQETTNYDSAGKTWMPTLVTCQHCGGQAAVGLRAT